MPKQTFYNLPKEKREKLIEAIKEEVSRVPYNKISINKIIKLAGIPRGSFYQYFHDKDDMLEYVLQDLRDGIFKIIINSLIETKGDIFKTLNNIFNEIIEYSTKNQSIEFFKNILSADNIFDKILSVNDEVARIKKIEKIIENINTDILRISNPEELITILEIVVSIAKDSFMESYIDITKVNSVRIRYCKKIEFLKYGLLKQENWEGKINVRIKKY